MSKVYYVYILSSKKNGTLYIGVTNNIHKRVEEHKSKLVPGFTAKYSVSILVYFEEFDNPYYAIAREKQLKGWRRSKKVNLIQSINRDWQELDPSTSSGRQ